MNKNKILNILGISLLGLFVIRLISLIYVESLTNFFWLCNHVPLVMGITIILRKSKLLAAEISLLSLGSIIWVLDLFSKLLFDTYITGSVDYLFPITDTLFFITTSFVHILTLPLAITAYIIIKQKNPKAWGFSLIHAIILLLPIYLFRKTANLNCMIEPCLEFIPDFTLYPLILLVSYMILIVIPTNKLLDWVNTKTK